MASLCLITVPVLLDTDSDGPHLVSQWARMYHYGHLVMPSISVATCVLYGFITASRRSARKSWRVPALAGAITVVMVPFTWVVMAPTNDRLFNLQSLSQVDPVTVDIAEVRDLVTSWWWLHGARCIFPLVGAVVGAVGLFW
ncbi:DUF1772-domain-containing protein [Cryphonectria parasitica EP155]|uniref:DUF1772-domain-containing protein n=1 Tax=Cryphonectria parasitica (strain ATCC 38755 / EP155) TaxID=660469 RepID=A0A9P4XXB1_CRYP1|nr:DUF1772-domain-containing protein [Cryphonectria parasitica EP155]KAF3762999.1 DUF1772-domain-containing protein [Cryphonectria parasitica EP155]